jgi:hypothetical protein
MAASRVGCHANGTWSATFRRHGRGRDIPARIALQPRRGARLGRRPINRECFLSYRQLSLVPTLKPTTVVADNLGSLKGTAIREAVNSAGSRLLFLPKYSPSTPSSKPRSSSFELCWTPLPAPSCKSHPLKISAALDTHYA